MSELNKFRERINKINNVELLNAAIETARIKMKINILNKELEELDGKITEGKNAMFFLFVERLNEEELPFIIEKIDQKIRRLDREKAKKEKKENGEKWNIQKVNLEVIAD